MTDNIKHNNNRRSTKSKLYKDRAKFIIGINLTHMNNNIPDEYKIEYDFQNTITEEEEEKSFIKESPILKRCQNPLCKRILPERNKEFETRKRQGKYCDKICKEGADAFNARLREVRDIRVRFF